MTSPAITAQGTKLAYSDGGSPSSFTDIPGVVRVSGIGGGATPVVDTSDLDSVAKEKMLILPDEGQVAVTLNPKHSNAVHAALRLARSNKTRLEWRCTFTDGKIAQFFGYVLTFASDAGMGDALRGAMSIEIDGPVSYA